MRTIRRVFILCICSAIICLNGASIVIHAEGTNNSTKINEIMQLLHSLHLSGVSEEKLTDAAIEGMIESLNDPYTQYFPAEEQSQLSYEATQIPIVTAQMFPEGVGYLFLAEFTMDADIAFSASLDELQKKGMKSLIIDLRDNPGGYIDTAKKIASHFIKNGVLMHIKNRDRIEKPIKITDGDSAAYPIVILVNENSASASELFAGALQDYKIAQIVGIQTYGKGVMQNILPVFNGGILKVTTEEYFTPNHHTVHHIGIKPDIEAYGNVEQLVKAMQAVGVKDFKLNLNNTTFELNNVTFPGSNSAHFIRLDGKKLYLPTRLLMTMIDGKVVWDAKSNAIELSQNNIQLKLPITSPHIIVREGISYINVELFSIKFPQLKWSMNKDSIALKASH